MPEFFEAPLKFALAILTLVGGSGGVMYWIDRYRDKPRLVVHSVLETAGHNRWQVMFQVENIGRNETSLAPHVSLTAIDIGGDKISARLKWGPEVNRRLVPHAIYDVTAVLDGDLAEPRAAGSPEADLTFSAFRRYKLKLTRGVGYTVRVEKFNSPPSRNGVGFWWKALRSRRERRRLFSNAFRAVQNHSTPESPPSVVDGETCAADASSPRGET